MGMEKPSLVENDISFHTQKTMQQSHGFLTVTHIFARFLGKMHPKLSNRTASLRNDGTPPPEDFLELAHALDEPENFFVGLPEGELPQPKNILAFYDFTLPDPSIRAAHHRYLLILNLKSPVRILLDSRLLLLPPAQALLVFPFQSHRYLKRPPTEPFSSRVLITFEMEEPNPLDSLRNRCVGMHEKHWVLAREILQAYLAAVPMKPSDAVAAWLTLLLLHLRQQISPHQPSLEWEPHPGEASHRVVQRASQWIETHLAENFSIQDLAREIHVSSGYLRACFHDVLGLPVHAMIQKTRIYKACSLLSRTEFNMTEIAEQCGFGSLYAFSRAFRRHIGMPPTRYRFHLWEKRNIRG